MFHKFNLLFFSLIFLSSFALAQDLNIQVSYFPTTVEVDHNYSGHVTITNIGNNEITEISGYINSIFSIIKFNNSLIKIDKLNLGESKQINFSFVALKGANGVEIVPKINSYKREGELVLVGSPEYNVSVLEEIVKVEHNAPEDEVNIISIPERKSQIFKLKEDSFFSSSIFLLSALIIIIFLCVISIFFLVKVIRK